jgi:hypothetical protein
MPSRRVDLGADRSNRIPFRLWPMSRVVRATGPDPSNPLPCPSEDRIEASDRIAQRGAWSTLDTKWELKFETDERS